MDLALKTATPLDTSNPNPNTPYRPLPAATPYFNSVVQHLKPIAA